MPYLLLVSTSFLNTSHVPCTNLLIRNTDPTYVQQFQAEARRVHAENNIRRKQALDYRNSEAARVAESRNAGQHAKQAIRVFPPLPFKPPPVNDTDLFEVTIGGPASEQTAQIERQDMNVDPVDSDLEYDGEVEKKSCTQCRWDNEYTRCSSLKSGMYISTLLPDLFCNERRRTIRY